MQQPPNRKSSAVLYLRTTNIQYNVMKSRWSNIHMLIAPAFYLILSAAGWCCMLRYMMITCRNKYATATSALLANQHAASAFTDDQHEVKMMKSRWKADEQHVYDNSTCFPPANVSINSILKDDPLQMSIGTS